MKNLLIILFATVRVAFSQSNTPCSSPPNLPVGTNCNYTIGSTIGATYQSNAANGGTPSCGSPGAPDVWYTITAPAGGSVQITTQTGTITDLAMSVYSGSCPNSFTQIACDDDSGPGLMPQLTLNGLTPGATYFVRLWRFGSGTGTFQICASLPAPPAGNASCANPDPICSGIPIAFTANTGEADASTTNPGNNYGCLFTSPNPTWYYLEIANGGNLVVDIFAASDVDFAIWGPFSNLANAISNCNTYGTPVDCSYSTAPVEQVNVPNAVTGEVYVLLVTNYANTIQTINVNNGGGTATTNCSIVVLDEHLSSYQVQKESSKGIINWSLQDENLVTYHAVQKSTDGKFWETIDVKLPAKSAPFYYQTIDNQLMVGQNYYRIVTQYIGGNYKVSAVKNLAHRSKLDVNYYPSLVDDELFVELNSEEMQSIRFYDAVGREFELNRSTNNNLSTFDTSPLTNGLYYLEISSEFDEVQKHKFLVQHP